MDLTSQIVNIMRENNIEGYNMLDTLSNIYSNIESSLFNKIETDPSVFYAIKDIVWYNLEYLPNTEKGIANLSSLGSKFPHVIYSFNESDYIRNKDLHNTNEELKTIISKWNDDLIIAHIYSNSNFKQNDKIIIHDNTETYKKYLPKDILNINGKSIENDYKVFCALSGKIGNYNKIFYNYLLKFQSMVEKSIKENKDLRIEVNYASESEIR